MRKICYAIILLAVCLVSCNNTDDLWDEVDDLKNRVTSLETQIKDLNANIEAIRELAKEGATITSVEEKDGAYKVTMSDGKILNLVQQTETTNLLPVIGIDEGGYWIVSYNGETPKRIKDTNGNDIKAKGENGVTPKFSVDAEGYWMIQYGSNAPERVKDVNGNDVKATGDAGSGSADSFFETVEKRANELYIKLKTGQEMTIPIVSNFSCVIDATGTQSFTAGEVKTFNVTMKGVDNTMITAPSGWKAELSKDELKPDDATAYILKVTAPTAAPSARAVADNSKDIAILATSGAYAAIAKIQVEVKFVTDYKADFENGKDITIGHVTINNRIYAEADIQLLDATDADVSLDSYFSATMSKPVILFLTGTAHNFTTTGVKSISNDVIIIGQYDNELVNVRPVNCWKSCKGKLLIKNTHLNLTDINGGSNAAYFINNAGVVKSGDFTDISIDKCKITNVQKSIYYDAANVNYYGVNKITVQDTRIQVNAVNIALINIYKGFNLGDYKTFSFKNNIVYSSTPQGGVQIFNWAAGNTPKSDGVLEAEIVSNTVVNIVGSNPYFRFQKGTALTISKNIFDVSPTAEFGAYFYTFIESCTPQMNVTDNIIYGLTKNWSYYHADSQVKDPASSTITKHGTDPITDYDFENGIFTLANDVAGYGAVLK